MSDADDDARRVIVANAAFYAAFADGDYLAMEGLWAETAEVSCVHPGWPPVRGRDTVMQTWKGILANPPHPAIRALEASATVAGDVGLVVCYEAIGDSFLVASNLFLREGDLWRLIHHQAGPTDHIPKSADPRGSRAIH